MDEISRDNLVKLVFSRLAIGLSLMLAATSILLPATLALIELLSPEVTHNINATFVISMLILYFVGIVAYFCLQRLVPSYHNSLGECQKPIKIKVFGLIKLVLISLGLGFILNLATIGMNFSKNLIVNMMEAREYARHYLEYGYSVLPQPPTFVETDPLMDFLSGINPIVSILFIVVLTSIFEEYIFRKLLYDKLIVFGGKVFVVISSLMFALFHINQHQLLYTFGIGLIFAGVMYFTKKVSYCILLHMGFNLLGTLALHVQTFSEWIVLIYLNLHLVLIIIGIVLLVKWLNTYRMKVKFEPPEIKIENIKSIFFNPGMIAFLILTVGTMILQGVM